MFLLTQRWWWTIQSSENKHKYQAYIFCKQKHLKRLITKKTFPLKKVFVEKDSNEFEPNDKCFAIFIFSVKSNSFQQNYFFSPTWNCAQIVQFFNWFFLWKKNTKINGFAFWWGQFCLMFALIWSTMVKWFNYILTRDLLFPLFFLIKFEFLKNLQSTKTKQKK